MLVPASKGAHTHNIVNEQLEAQHTCIEYTETTLQSRYNCKDVKKCIGSMPDGGGAGVYAFSSYPNPHLICVIVTFVTTLFVDLYTADYAEQV